MSEYLFSLEFPLGADIDESTVNCQIITRIDM